MNAVLMICDPVESKFSLLDRATTMAQRYSAKLHVLDLVYIKGLEHIEDLTAPKRQRIQDSMIKERKKALREVLEKNGVDSKKAMIHVVWEKDLSKVTLELCKKINPVLVVKQATTKNKQIFHTPTDWRLIERCPAPLLISPLQSIKKKSRIMVAVDLATKVKSKAALNQKLLETAKIHADASGAELHIACCASISPFIADLDIVESSAYRKKMKQKVLPQIDVIKQQYGIADVCIHFKTGQPAKVLNGIAQKLKADMVIAGAIGRHGLKGRLLGNTAELMLQHLHTDLLLIRP